EEQVEKGPHRIAVVDTVQDSRYLTYRELNAKSNHLAAYLQTKVAGEEDAIAISAETSLEMVIGILAILKAGGGYLSLNPDYPVERKRYLLNDADISLLLTDSRQTGNYRRETIQLTPTGTPVISEDGHCEPCLQKRQTTPPQANNLAYIIYTSGSSGKPKGVMVEHRNVVRLVKNTNILDFREGDRILQTGALEFDASTFEIWGALLNGLELHLAPKETILTPEKLKKIIRNHKISTLWMTAPLFNRMVEADIEIFQTPANLLAGGDVLSTVHIGHVKRRYPDLNIINGYGPTENTTFSTTFHIKKEYKKNIPIGKPIANSTAYIMDKFENLVPIGINGELVVGGDGVARGYLNNPELTAEKFIDYPKANRGHHESRPHQSQSPIRIYKTGDLAKWMPDGNIQFSGRIDDQVKVRGFRIE
ncbi:MAG: amino acid adenylation domain-containing protein, partial [bacterium]|nr:amino acid adenylation domain-containing protein [bacterium]